MKNTTVSTNTQSTTKTTLVLGGNGVLEPFVDADDIADVAVPALTDDRHAGQL